jgi:hypothetical protein
MSTTLGVEASGTEGSASRGSSDFRVAIFAHVDEPTDVTEVLTTCAGLHPDDAMRAAHLSPGLVPLHLTNEVAQAVVEQLQARGIRAVAIPQAHIPSLDQAVTIHQPHCAPDGLELFGIHGELKRRLPWADVSLLSAGSVPIEDGQRLPAEPQIVLHAAPNPHRAVTETTRRLGLFLWMVCEHPWQVYRFVHNQTSYGFLGARKTTSTTRNFNLFLEELASHAPYAYLTPATRALLHHGIRRHFEFHSSQELRDYTVFHLLAQKQVSQLARHPGASPTLTPTSRA